MVHESKTAETIERISAALSKQFVFKGIDTGILQQVRPAGCCHTPATSRPRLQQVAGGSVSYACLVLVCLPQCCETRWAAAHASLKLSPIALSMSAALDPT